MLNVNKLFPPTDECKSPHYTIIIRMKKMYSKFYKKIWQKAKTVFFIIIFVVYRAAQSTKDFCIHRPKNYNLDLKFS